MPTSRRRIIVFPPEPRLRSRPSSETQFLISVAVEIIADPERLEAVPDSAVFTPRIAPGVAWFLVAAMGVDRPVTEGPNVEGTGRFRLCIVAGPRIDPGRSPDQIVDLRVSRR